MIRQVISYIHYSFLVFFVVFPYITPYEYLAKALYFWCGTIYHWYCLNGRCWMSILEDQFKAKTEPETNTVAFFEDYNIPKYVFDIMIYCNFLVAFYKLNILSVGICYCLVTMCMNKLIYKTIVFK